MNKEAKGLTRRELLALFAALGAAQATPPRAQDVAKVNPRSYRVVLENDSVRVLEYLSKPGLSVCGVGRHSHPKHLTVVLSGGRVKVTHADGKVHVADPEPGKIFWSPAETHEIENISGRDKRAYIIEIKDKDWKPSTG
jgi:quercetin dioxygenase-like cupin family protein